MYNITTIAEILESASMGIVGADIFVYHAPPEKQDCMILYPSAEYNVIDPETPTYYTSRFQVIIRNAKFQEGIELCKQIETVLTIFNQDTTDIKIKRCRPLHQARVYRRADSGLIEFSINFDIRYIIKT